MCVRIKIMKVSFLYSMALLLTFHVLLAAEADDHIFVSRENDFSMQYPKTWNRAETVHPQTVIRLESTDGNDYNIGVTTLDPELRGNSPDEFVQGMLPNVEYLVTNILSKNFPDAKLLKKGRTTLSQQPALFYIMDFTISAAGREIPMRSYVIVTKYNTKQYTLTFRSPQPFFDQYMPAIQRLALGFQFTKTKIE